ncbi:MAG TPA: DUF4157 domain-containing protein [Kofleriaceae bacterium]|jgi:hypothetical protein|nr:DUF4157 domain-containing protein [Kofleriaceae bacterium]
MSEHAEKQSRPGASHAAPAQAPTPGKHTLVEQEYAAIQRRAAAGAAGAERTEDVHAAAARGVATPAQALPHADRIQRAFGRHDVSGIQAHVGGEAAASADAMGAQAYATGDHVVLGGTDLSTVAHEAAHVVQQRGGVQLKGGVGTVGDPHEQHADAVAARVTAGESAEDLLDQYGGSGAAAQVQHKPKTVIEDTDPKNHAAGEGPGALATVDKAAGTREEHAVRFGGLVNDCGSSMEAWLYPSDKTVGSAPSVRPSWWTAMNSDPGTDGSWVSNNVVQGHLLNHNLGGPGDDMRNLTPFAKSTNSQHHTFVEKAAKDIKARGNIMHYKVAVDYSKSPPAAWFAGKIAATYLAKFAGGITCELEEFDGKTHKSLGTLSHTTVSNAITGQG